MMLRLYFHTLFLSCLFICVLAFQPSVNKFRLRNDATKLQGSFLASWLRNVREGDNNKKEPQTQEQDSPTTKASAATVTRLAARKYDKNASKPSSRDYTTRKDSCTSVTVTFDGVKGDYNHYRTVALKSTSDRAISLLTQDVMIALQASFPASNDGDLGENVLLENIKFNDLQIGQQYMFGSSKNNNNTVVIQVTEPMIPCANLCKLSYINDDRLAPKERIAKCQALLEFLDKPGDGFRGWYAKVISPGDIQVGDEFFVVE